MKFGLKDSTIRQITDVLSRFPQVKKVVLYGSRAKGNFRNGSDIDLTFFGDSELNLRVLFQISHELDDLLLPWTFDLSIFQDIHDPDVVAHIQRVGVLFYEKK